MNAYHAKDAAACLLGLAMLGVSGITYAAATCTISEKFLHASSFVLKDVKVANTGNTALSDWKVEILFDKNVQATNAWGGAASYLSNGSSTITVFPAQNTLAANQSMLFSIKGSSSGQADAVSCRVIAGGGGGTPPPNPPPVGTPERCAVTSPPVLLAQAFESFGAGTPALSQESSFKQAFCVPLRNISGFGNEAEPDINTLSPREQAARRAREAAGQYNGASDKVRVTIDNTANALRGKSLRVMYPKGTNSSSHSGTQFDMVIPSARIYNPRAGTTAGTAYEELYLSYWVKFEPGADLAQGGKLPGLYGLEAYNAPSRTNEVKARIMWRQAGRLEFYLHSESETRERLLWDNIPGKGHAAIAPGSWHNIEMRVKLNTVQNGVAQPNGIMQGWIDGELRADYRDVRFRNSANVNLNAVFFSTFYGGSGGSGEPQNLWWPNRDVHAWFDEVTVDKAKINNWP